MSFRIVVILALATSLTSCKSEEKSSSDSDQNSDTSSTSTLSNGTATMADFDGEATTAELQIMLNNSQLSCSAGDILSFDGENWSCSSTITNFQSTGITDNATSEAVTIDENGNVGIGTTAPASNPKLEVVRDYAGDADTMRDVAWLSRSFSGGVGADGIGAYLSLGGEDSSGVNKAAGRVGGALTSATNGSLEGALVFETWNTGSHSERMRIDHNGNIGIGTTDPKSNLQVSGYIQLDLTSGTPPAGDCDHADERGRMQMDNATGTLYICADSGWVSK